MKEEGKKDIIYGLKEGTWKDVYDLKEEEKKDIIYGLKGGTWKDGYDLKEEGKKDIIYGLKEGTWKDVYDLKEEGKTDIIYGLKEGTWKDGYDLKEEEKKDIINGLKEGTWKDGDDLKEERWKNGYDYGLNKLEGTLNSIFAVAMVYGVRARVFIDTGASVTLVSTELISRLGAWGMVTPCKMKIRSLTKNIVPVKGQIRLDLEMGGQIINQNCIVSEYNESDILIGLDYLKRAEAVLDIPNGKLLTPNGEEMFIVDPQSVERIKTIKCAKTITMPANSVSYISCSFSDGNNEGNRSGIFVPSHEKTLEDGVLMGHSLVYSEGAKVILQAVNLTDESTTVLRGKIIGELHPVMMEEDMIRGVRLEDDEASWLYGDSEWEAGVRNGKEGLLKKIQNTFIWEKDDFFEKLRVEEMEITEEERSKTKALLWEYRDCFSVNAMDLGCCNMYEATISLKPDTEAKWIANRPVPYKLRGIMDKKIEELEGAGVIEKYDGSSPWNSPTMLVKKNGSNDYRVVQDGRYLNSCTVPDTYEMANVRNVIDNLQDCKYLSTMDITTSFNQILLDEGSRYLTAFQHNNIQYVFNRMTMGSRNSSAKFCRMISKLLGQVPFSSILAFVDDILAGSETFESHLERLEFIFMKLRSANLKLKPGKCFFFRKEISFLGFTISKEGVKIDQSRIQPILDLKPPTNVKGVQSIIGLFNYSRQFIKDFASKVQPLYKLLKKDMKKFVWTKECEESLAVLKLALTTAPALAIPDIEDLKQSYRVEIDSSAIAWGAVLTQIIDEERKTVAYYSKSIPKYKRRVGASRLEFLGLYHALKHWKQYLINTHFLVLTDCLALVNLETLFSKSSTIQQRQLMELQNFNMTIKHISGVSNYFPDFLSRYNYQSQTCDIGVQTEDQQNHSVWEDIKRIWREETSCEMDRREENDDEKDSYEMDRGEDDDDEKNSCEMDRREENDDEKDSYEMDMGEDDDDEKDSCEMDMREENDDEKDSYEMDMGEDDDDEKDSCEMDMREENNDEKDSYEMDMREENDEKDSYEMDRGEYTNDGETSDESDMGGETSDELEEDSDERDMDERDISGEIDMDNDGNAHVQTNGERVMDIQMGDRVEMDMGKDSLITDLKDNWSNLEVVPEEEELQIVFRRENQKEVSHRMAMINVEPLEGQGDQDDVLDQDEFVLYDQKLEEEIISPVTLEDIRQGTEKDPVLQLISKWVEEGVKPKSIQNMLPPKELVSLWKSFRLLTFKDGILYRKWTAIKPPFREKDLIVIPYELQERLLKYYHWGILSVHAGVEACWYNCSKHFWWSGMKKEFKLFIAACVKCQRIKQPRAYLRAPLQTMVYTNFNDMLAIDHIVPSTKKKSENGYRYVLCMVDAFTNFLVCIPVKTQTAEETIRNVIQHWILKHGMPLRLMSDRAAGFSSELFEGIMKEFGISHKRTTSFHSQGNAKIERQNGRINAAMRAVIPY